MKPISLRTVALAAPLFTFGIIVYGCSPDDGQVNGTGGTSNAGSAGTPSAGTPSGGSGAGTPSGGTAGTPSGGSGAGTPNGGTAGTPSGGTAGTAGTGGAGGGAGGGGACGSDPAACVNELVSGPSSFTNPGWKDSWWVTGCAEKNNHDCITIAQCPGGEGEMRGARTVESFPVGGVKGQKYKVTFRYSAVNEGKVYTGGKKDTPTPNDFSSRQNNDTFYRDGQPVFPSNYNVLKLTVKDDNGGEARHFYMNAFDSSDAENHWNFRSEYTKSIVIIGGGTIEHMVQDANCHAIDNCNDGMVVGQNCASPRNLPGADGQLMLPAKYMDPGDQMVKNTELLLQQGLGTGRTQPWHAQASHLTVTAAEPTNDPVTMNY